MKKILFGFVATLLALVSLVASADELTGYVQNCESALGFTASQVPTLRCNDGVLFKGGKPTDTGPENDFVGHARINSNVDLVFACRWLFNKLPVYSNTAVTIELLIHNRSNGGTCFFEAKDFNPPVDPTIADPQVSTTIISPTAANASSYWMQPKELDAKKFDSFNGTLPNANLRCVGCHIAGPYIASPDIAPFLAQFGLLNDGHDTFASRYHAVLPPAPQIFGIPTGPSSFWLWNSLIQANNSTTGLAVCASSCHSIGLNSTTDFLISSVNSDTIVPSIRDDINSVNFFGVMPANNPTNTGVDNSYNWVNMNSPLNDPNGEFEMLFDVQNRYPGFYCSNPVSLDAHVIDSNEIIKTNAIPDNLHRFNLQDGLVCLNNEQPRGRQCQDYQTRYMCNGRFTAFQNLDDPSYSGDWEPRNSFKGLCANPTWIQARYKSGGVWTYVNGPPDRLAEFDTDGLVCYNSDQNNGQCSNYVVRFVCP